MWKSSTEVAGGLCVVLAGTCVMPQWSVVNWAMAQLWGHRGVYLEVEVVQLCMTMCAAVAVKPASLSVPMFVLKCKTVATGKMQE